MRRTSVASLEVGFETTSLCQGTKTSCKDGLACGLPHRLIAFGVLGHIQRFGKTSGAIACGRDVNRFEIASDNVSDLLDNTWFPVQPVNVEKEAALKAAATQLSREPVSLIKEFGAGGKFFATPLELIGGAKHKMFFNRDWSQFVSSGRRETCMIVRSPHSTTFTTMTVLTRFDRR
eukprot:976733-Pyramimonas_sp.AAC.1